MLTGLSYPCDAGPMANNPNLYELAYHKSSIAQWESVATGSLEGFDIYYSFIYLFI